jgi:hypothetical protein
MTDGILMVIQSGKTQYKVVRHSLNLLAGAGARIFGVVLNQVAMRRHDHYYHSYYQQPAEDADQNTFMPAELIPPLRDKENRAEKNESTKNLDLPSHESQSEPASQTTENTAQKVAAKNDPSSDDLYLVENATPLAKSEEGWFTEESDDEKERILTLCAVFDHPSQAVREGAVQALNKYGADRLTAFARALREAPFARRRRIGAAIASSGLADEAINHLMSGDEKYYDALSLLLLMMKAGEAQPLLRAIKEHPDNNVRIAAISLLALSQQKDFTAELRHIAFHDPLPPEVQSALLTALHLPVNS